MTAEIFLDTNVLVYAADSSPANRSKKIAALRLIEAVDFGLSYQVLQEFYVTVTRKLRQPLDPTQALAFLDQLLQFPVVASDGCLVIEGIRNSLKYQTSYWDGAIIAAAQRLQAKVLYSEDLNHGQYYGSVQVQNPFLN